MATGPSFRLNVHMVNHGFQRILATALMVVVPAMLSVAAGHAAKPPSTGAGKKRLLLFAKNPASWAIVKGGAGGELVYHEVSGVFTLNAAGLHPRSAYALVRYADAPPRAEILAKGMSDSRGRLELSGVWRNWSRKFWLVAGEDVEGSVGEAGTFRAWRPVRYLFEEKQLGIACACPEPEEP